MQIFDFISLTLESTKENILRTSLSIISVVIGVFSFVFVVSLNEGMAENITKIIENQGGYNTFEIKLSSKNIIRKKIKSLNKINSSYGIRYPITLSLIDSLNIHFPKAIFTTEFNSPNFVNLDNNEFNLLGVSDIYYGIYKNIELLDGNFFNILDIKYKNNVAIISNNVDNIVVGNFINIGGYQFEILGKYISAEQWRIPKAIFIPITTANTLFGSHNKRFKKIIVKVKDVKNLNFVKDRIRNYLNLAFDKNMFKIQNKEKDIKKFNNISASYSNLILLFSILMLITGGIGIMNIMLASIRERMREIGIKKAVGAKNRDIFIQFFLETMFLFFIGGSIGIILAVFSVESVAELIIKKQMWGEQAKALITYRVIVTSIIFTGITGLAFGLLPAIKASKIMPIDSLRYE